MDGHVKTAKLLTDVLDNKFSFFGIKFGLDPIIGFVPILGDILPMCLSLYIVWIGMQSKIPNNKIAQMLANTLFDFVIGIIPVVGDAADFVVKANKRNFEILQNHLNASPRIIEGEIVR
jgi:Domain of unknown function (DUF4112)